MVTTKRSDYIYKCSQLLSWAICLTCFALNVSFTLISHIENETIQSVESKAPHEGLFFPSFAVCPKKPFWNESSPMLTLDEYDDNAYDPKDFNVTIDYKNFAIGEYYKEDILRTLMFGKCLYYEMEDKIDWKQVRPSDFLMIRVANTNATGFEFLMMNPNDRLTFHLQFLTSKLENDYFVTFSSDGKVSRVTFPLSFTHYKDETEANCSPDWNTEQEKECLARSLHHIHEYQFGCSTPMTLSMFGNHTVTKEHKMCSYVDYNKSNWYLMDAGWLELRTGCLKPCEEQSFKSKPIISERIIPELGCLPEQPCIILRPAMGSQKVKHFKLKYKVSLNDLVSSIGGGLGLFLGFSILATFNTIANYLSSKNK